MAGSINTKQSSFFYMQYLTLINLSLCVYFACMYVYILFAYLVLQKPEEGLQYPKFELYIVVSQYIDTGT